jgi:hypothetical protein
LIDSGATGHHHDVRPAAAMVMWVTVLGCSSGPGTGNVELAGAFEKGPFVLGSSVQISALDTDLNPTGELFSTQTVDDAGRFTLAFEVDDGLPLSIQGSGFYYNEVTGALSQAPIILQALDETTEGSHDAFVNVVTHLAYLRARQLVFDGMAIVDAEAAAESELRAQLHVGPADFDPGTAGLNLTMLGGDTDANAYLFAVSSVLAQAAADAGGPIDAALQELLSKLALDLADDGSLDAARIDTLVAAQRALDSKRIKEQFAMRLASIGSPAVVPDLDRMIDSDGDGVVNSADNCLRISNPDQLDSNSNGLGDPCDNLHAYVKAASPLAGEQFGGIVANLVDPGEDLFWASTVAISGDTMVVGVPQRGATPNVVNDGIGAVHVFVRSGAAWVEQAVLLGANTEMGDRFGRSVAIDGDTIVVGAPGEASAFIGDETDNTAPFAGAAYVFARSGVTWTQQAYLKLSTVVPRPPTTTIAGFQFGMSVAISGDTVVVGAPYDASRPDGSTTGAFGSAHVFVRSNGAWTQEARLESPTPHGSDQFGSVAISGDTIAVGAYNEDRNTGEGATGGVSVFVRAGTTWTLQAHLTGSNRDAGDLFGAAVSLVGDTLAVGAQDEASNGAPLDNSLPVAGAVYIFERTGTTWTQQAYLKPSNMDAGDRFGATLSLTPDTLVVGAPGEDSAAFGAGGDPTSNATPGAGAAYVFTRTGASWVQRLYLKASNTDANDQFGRVAISGKTVVVASPGEDGGSAGITSDPASGQPADNSVTDSGAVYVFELP